MACEPVPESFPDALLQDSLGLEPGDRVHTVTVRHDRGLEVAEPDSVLVYPGDWVDFVTEDAYPRVVRFHADSLSHEAREFLQEIRMMESPPLVRPGVHWVLHAESAPPGRYTYQVDGSGASGRGVVVVVPAR
ncbi:MAG: hypothetical protein JSU98_08965 [Gemmatimonadales bacterium]|nr:MAG: hypothetical protein JSU98_08965 [Gemmatimonadales bacterium]